MEKIRCPYLRIAGEGKFPPILCTKNYKVELVDGKPQTPPNCLELRHGFTDRNCNVLKDRPVPSFILPSQDNPLVS